MKKVKLLVSFAVTASIVFGGFSTAFAKVDGYTVKDSKTSIIRQYDTEELSQSFLDQTEGVGEGTLYKEFKKDSEENGIHTIHDNSRKYVDYKSALKQAEEQSKSGQTFALNQYVGDAEAEETPEYVYDRKVKEGEVVSGLNITKDGFIADLSSGDFGDFEDVHITAKDVAVTNGTIKGELILDSEGLVIVKNIKGQSIKAVAGDIHLTKVEADQLEVKGNKEIKIESNEGTNIKNTKVESYAVIDSKAGTLGTVAISVDEKGSKTIELKGTFTQPVIVKSGVELKVDKNAKLAKVEIDTPKGAEVKLSGNVGEVEVKSETNIKVEEGTKAEITGTGEGEKSVIDADKNTDVTVKDIDDIKGDGADEVETGNTGSNNSSSGNSGSSKPTTISRSSFGEIINGILGEADKLDNILNGTAGYFGLDNTTWSKSSGSNILNKVTITVKDSAKDLTLGDIMQDVKDSIDFSNLNDPAYGKYYTFKNYLKTKITNIDVLKGYLETIFPGTNGDFAYDVDHSFVQNILALMNMEDSKEQIIKAAQNDNGQDTRAYEGVPAVELASKKVTSIKVDGQTIYTKGANDTGSINIDTVEDAFEVSEATTMTLEDLAGKDIVITFSNGETYTFRFVLN